MKNSKLLLSIILSIAFIIISVPLLRVDHLAGKPLEIDQGLLRLEKGLNDSQVHEIKGNIFTVENALIQNSQDIKAANELRAFPQVWLKKDKVQYASQSFEIVGLEKGEVYGFYLMDALTAYTIFVDGHEIATMGTVSDRPETAVAASKCQSAYFIAKGNQAEVVIWVSNYITDKTGIWQKTYLGTQNAISHYEERLNISDAFSVGAIFFISVYLWILFIVHRKDRTILYFAVCCTFITIKSIFSGQQIGFESYPVIQYTLGIRIAYLAVVGMAASFMAFVSSYFVKESNRKIAFLFMLLSLIEAMVVLFTPHTFFMATFWCYQLAIPTFFIVTLYWVYKGILNKTEGARICMIGFLLFFGFAINDILYSLLLIKTGYYLSIGLIILVMVQATLVAIRLSNALAHETYVKQNLETIVGERTRDLEAEKNRFENLSKVDSLTLLYNKGYMLDVLEVEFENYKRYNGLFSLVMLDLDHFKAVNDNYGHVVGDQVLIKIAEVLNEQSRKGDIIGRFGGEEFLIIQRFTSAEDAAAFSEHLRMVIQKIRFTSDKGPFSLTASFGIAEATWNGSNEVELLKHADMALYRAKNQGRNRVEIYKNEG